MFACFAASTTRHAVEQTTLRNRGVSAVCRCAADLEIADRLCKPSPFAISSFALACHDDDE